jgi:hypothetical protein
MLWRSSPGLIGGTCPSTLRITELPVAFSDLSCLGVAGCRCHVLSGDLSSSLPRRWHGRSFGQWPAGLHVAGSKEKPEVDYCNWLALCLSTGPGDLVMMQPPPRLGRFGAQWLIRWVAPLAHVPGWMFRPSSSSRRRKLLDHVGRQGICRLTGHLSKPWPWAKTIRPFLRILCVPLERKAFHC